jgi:hypothetical protein
MPKVFYTEKDIEDMVKLGILSLEVNDNVVLTDLAYEKANRLGLKLIRDKPENPPAAPVRPYIVQKVPNKQMEAIQATPVAAVPPRAATDLAQRIHNAVITRLGSQVDAALLDAIIQRVLSSTGVK